MTEIGLGHYLTLGAVIFSIGVIGIFLNRKNISVYLSSANVMDFDIYRKSRDLELSFGSNTLLPQTGYTFAEYVDRMLHDQIRNSHVIKYKKNYITLEDIHQDYITNSNFTPYNFPSVNEFVNKIGPYWTQVLDQVIPSTTLWTGGNLIQNGIFGRPKYSYRFGCKPKEIIENVYPKPITSGYQPFQDEIEQFDEYYEFSTEIDETGESSHDGYIRFFPTFELDGVLFSGSSNNSSTYVLISGSTPTATSARLYTGNGNEIITNNPSLYSNDFNQIKQLWKTKNQHHQNK